MNHWRHLLLGQHFTLITDQRSVAYMYDTKNSSKIKNDKILRWRIELSPYSYDIQYRPRKYNVVADTFSQALCTTISTDNLYSLHSALCHPGITCMYHLVCSRKLPYSLDSVKQICKDCKICQEVKPQYFKPEQAKLIKATQPFKCLSIDFKGPLPSTKYEYYADHSGL